MIRWYFQLFFDVTKTCNQQNLKQCYLSSNHYLQRFEREQSIIFFILEVRWRNFIFHNCPHFMLPIPSLNCSLCNQLSTKLCNKMHKHKIKYSHKCQVHFWSLYISHICLNTSIIYVMANTDPIYLMFAKAEFNLDILGIKS